MAGSLNTIKSRQDFLKASECGRKVLSSLFVCLVRKKGQEQTRWGFTVSKKISKKAVVRNKVRRRLKESVRALLPVRPGYDIVLIARQGMLGASHAQLRAALDKAVKDARVGDGA